MYEVGQALGLTILGGITGIASAGLAVSAFTLVVPILIVMYDLHTFDALFISFFCDFVNGFLVFFMYRKYLPEDAFRSVISLSLISTVCALLVCNFVGIEFVKSHEDRFKHGVTYFSFIIAFVLLFKAYRIWRSSPITDSPEIMRVPLLDLDDVETVVIPDAVYMELEDASSEIGNEEGQVNAVISSVCFFGIMSCFSGVVGFGGGNAYAMYFILVLKWPVTKSTSASGLISASVMLSMVVLYIWSGVIVDPNKVSLVLGICLPVDFVVNVFTCFHMKELSEHVLMFLVGVIFVIIGAAAAILA